MRSAELALCGRALADDARRLADAVGAFDRRAGDGSDLPHPVAVEAYERFFGAWSLRLHEVVEEVTAGAQAVTEAAERYVAWEQYVARLTR